MIHICPFYLCYTFRKTFSTTSWLINTTPRHHWFSVNFLWRFNLNFYFLIVIMIYNIYVINTFIGSIWLKGCVNWVNLQAVVMVFSKLILYIRSWLMSSKIINMLTQARFKCVSACVYVCACVRVCVRTCVRACVRVSDYASKQTYFTINHNILCTIGDWVGFYQRWWDLSSGLVC